MPSWFGGGSAESGAGPAGGGSSAWAASALGGNSSGSKWINMDTSNIKTIGGELTGENSEFSKWGFELTRRQRLIGFIGCLIGGFAISILGTILLFTGAYALFAILYTIGVLVALVGTGFLIGFARQIKMMFAPVRIVATILLWASFAMVWVSAFAIKSTALAIVFCVVLYLAYIWYALSYIPYARTFVKNLFSKLF